MAFQTSVLRDGEWVTETVNFQAALRQASAAAGGAAAAGPAIDARPQAPVCGILSRTAVESPIVNWVLPVRLRCRARNDIAFIGDRFVRIDELRSDGQLHPVARKNDFGARIRSAAVLGDPLQHGLDDETPNAAIAPDGFHSCIPHASSGTDAAACLEDMPPKMLVLVLDSGDTVFLFLKERVGTPPEFVVAKHRVPRNVSFLGFHLAVDPSSRYMAAASPDGVLAVYELEDMSNLGAQYRSRGSFDPVKSVRLRAIQGVIHKAEFLYPRPADDYHVILILIVVRKERRPGEPVTRMVTYEWEVGDSLKEVFAEEKMGNRLPREHKMPMLIIPLKFSNAFFAVSPQSIGIVKDCLSGCPVFESLRTDPPSQTPLHHGAGSPLWTAWSRPFRRKGYFERTDIIYLAREDGAIIHIEIEATDLVPSVTNVGCIDSNINTAFATAYDVFSDILIIGGNSGPGGVWKLAPRSELEQVGILPNWSPVIDVASTTCTSASRRAAGTLPADESNPPSLMPRPDTVFTASGRGLKGSITQWRWGLQGRIGLDIESGEPIRQSWAFSLSGQEGGGLYALLSLPHSSAVLRFSQDFGHVEPWIAEDIPFDLTCRTLTACEPRRGTVIQVTERSVAIVTGLESSLFALSAILERPGFVADNAFVANDMMVMSSHADQGSQLHTFCTASNSVSHAASWSAQGEITCLSQFRASDSTFVVAGSVLDGIPWISVYSFDGELVAAKAIARASGHESLFEPLTSMLVVDHDKGEVYVVAGTRCGRLLNIKITGQGPGGVSWAAETVGVAPVEVFPCGQFDGASAALMCCDNNLVMMTGFSPQGGGLFAKKHTIWLTDANDASMAPPPVHSAYSLSGKLSAYSGHLSLMMQAGSRLLLAEIWPQVGPVPRSVSMDGTPTRIMYSETWGCLVVALLRGNRPTLAFVDAQSGETISTPSDKDRNATDFISGLGHDGDRIYGLHEWLYVKDGKTFSFILVATKDGRLLIVSVNKTKARPGSGQAHGLHYWTRYKRMLGLPIYSIVGDEQGIVFCADTTVHWEVLDLAEKKLRPMGTYRLDSPATTLRVAHGSILALTTLHSLEVIDYRAGRAGDMTLVYSDRSTRRTVHMMEAGAAALDGRPITLLSDQRGGITGVWIPWQQRTGEFDVVFEGRLPSAVRRFVASRSRPAWLSARGAGARYGAVPSTGSEGELMLGFSLDGSLQHLTLLGAELWRFLCVVQRWARRWRGVCAVSAAAAAVAGDGGDDDGEGDGDEGDEEHDVEEPQPLARLMHIDGDVLERCLQRRALERMTRGGRRMRLFCACLDGLEAGRHTRGFRDASVGEGERRAKYLALGYEVLAHLLAPVM